ncbi:hypothetical protein DMENIID0001_054350 [Sergentomyia squamirostris]
MEKLTLNDFKPRAVRKAILISLVLYFGKIFCGSSVIIGFAGIVLKNVGTEMNLEVAAVISTSMFIPSIFILFFLVDSWGRRWIIVLSALLTAVFYIPIAIMARFRHLWHIHDSFGIIFLGVVYCTTSMGVGNLPMQLSAEILPPKVRSTVCSTNMMIAWLGKFTLAYIFIPVCESVGMDVMIWCFVVSCFLEAVFLLKYFPETKGKTYDEIVKIL